MLDNTERAGIPACHSEICKFEDKSSAGYRTVIAALIRYAREAPATISFRWCKAREMLDTQRSNEATELLGEWN